MDAGDTAGKNRYNFEFKTAISKFGPS